MKEETTGLSENMGKRMEKDDFWDVEKLLPNARHTVRVPPRRAPGATDTKEITFGGEKENDRTDTVADVSFSHKALRAEGDEIIVRHSVPQHTVMGKNAPPEITCTPIVSYESKTSLIHRVRVFPWKISYHYYRDFCGDAARYADTNIPEGETVPFVPFFSYVPQYSQLRKDQLRYYLYWRSELRRGNVIETDVSYVYLYIYEIINTAGYETPKEEGLLMLYRIFFAFGKKDARLSRLLSEWIVDYSLVFELPVPDEIRERSDFSHLFSSSLKEFYVAPRGEGSAGYAEILLRFSNSYDYKKSHFYTEANKAYFDRYLPGALSAVVAQYSSGSLLFADAGMQDSHMVRNAFEEALASYRVRYRIEIDYASFSRSHEMRFLVSNILKHTENRLRALLGVKSRLSIYSLPTNVRDCIDRYCDEFFPKRSHMKPDREREIPAYEKLYDLPERELDLSRARSIELESWETTKRLTEAFSEEESDLSGKTVEAESAEPPIPPAETRREPEETADGGGDGGSLRALLGAFYPFAEAAYRADFKGERTVSAELGMLPDVVADRVNELAADALGDILLVDDGDGYLVLDDYRSLFESDTNE